MKIAFFGSSLVSAYWNGAATYYRGIIRALAERGHRITFYEPDAYDRQKHRDISDPPWAEVVVYQADQGPGELEQILTLADNADLVVKASGVGVFDEYLEEKVLALKDDNTKVIFWDVDAPATLERLRQDASDPFSECIPRYDAIFTYGGGKPVVDAYLSQGARACIPIYNALDATTHFPVPPEAKYRAELSFLGNRLPDREARVDEFFFTPAAHLGSGRFILGGSGWSDRSMPENIDYLGHIYTQDHNAFNSSPRAVLNISRDSMARYGFSPATRVFEVAGAGGCLITDAWEGIEQFLRPQREVLVAENGEEVLRILESLDEEKAHKIGRAARERVLKEHTYAHRASQVEAALHQLNR